MLKHVIISVNNENVKQWRKCALWIFFVFKSGWNYFKFLRVTVELRHLELLSFPQASTHIASANAKKSNRYLDQATIWPKIKISETQHIIYTIRSRILCWSLFTKKDYTLKSSCKKDIIHSVSLYPKTLFGVKMKMFNNSFSMW